MHTSAAEMPAGTVPRMSEMMFMGGMMDRMPMMLVVRTRLRVGLRKGDQAGEYDKGRDEFFLHHHSDHSWDMRAGMAGCGGRRFWAA